jgi:HSP20 family protein
MASAARKDPTAAQVVRSRRDTEPSRMLRALLGWDPYREMVDDPFLPTFDVEETQDGFRFQADMPGVNEGDLSIDVNGNRITISGSFFHGYGSFSRSFTLPDGTDAQNAEAKLEDGVLSIIAPRKPKKTKS